MGGVALPASEAHSRSGDGVRRTLSENAQYNGHHPSDYPTACEDCEDRNVSALPKEATRFAVIHRRQHIQIGCARCKAGLPQLSHLQRSRCKLVQQPNAGQGVLGSDNSPAGSKDHDEAADFAVPKWWMLPPAAKRPSRDSVSAWQKKKLRICSGDTIGGRISARFFRPARGVSRGITSLAKAAFCRGGS